VLFYCPRIDRGRVVIDGEEAHHLIHVLRVRTGAAVKLFDGKGTVGVGVVSNISKDSVEIAVHSVEIHMPRVTGRVVIAASIAKGERFDWLVSKCVELGVDRICPVLFERTVKQAGGHSIARYNKLALASAKQCERLFLPQIEVPAKLIDCLSRLSQDYPNARILFGSTDEKAGTIFEETQGLQDYIAFIGPEGGLTADEEQTLLNNEAVGVGLTETVLRIETAAIAFASILCVKLH
jgi:16S rRNA (uracil1498-N3)-methyltransferase